MVNLKYSNEFMAALIEGKIKLEPNETAPTKFGDITRQLQPTRIQIEFDKQQVNYYIQNTHIGTIDASPLLSGDTLQLTFPLTITLTHEIGTR